MAGKPLVIDVTCPKCIVCGEQETITVLKKQFDAWRDGVYVQNAFPDLTADQRELLVTGTHSACWDAIAPEDDDEPIL